jgi:phenylacetate-CoA ligase
MVLGKRWQKMSPEELKEYQWQKLTSLLNYAYNSCPFYRHSFDEAGVKPEDINSFDDFYKRVPFIARDTVIANQANNPPFGDFLTVPREEISHLYYAPGPIMMAFTREDFDNVVTASANVLSITGAKKGDILDLTLAYNWVIAGELYSEVIRRLGVAVIPGGIGNSRQHIEVMRLCRGNVFLAFTPFAATLGETIKEMGLNPRKDLNIRLVIIAGEVRSEAAKDELSQAFGGAEVRELYGTAQLDPVAAECSYGGGMHLGADTIVEIVDPTTGEQVSPGAEGELVGTNLIRRSMPIIRWRTGDLTAGLNLASCPCGIPTPKLQRILGRTGDILRIKGQFVVPSQVEGVISRYPELGKFQIIVDRPRLRDELIIRVECKKPVSEDLRVKIINELKNAIIVTPEIELVPAGTIPEGATVAEDRRRL